MGTSALNLTRVPAGSEMCRLYLEVCVVDAFKDERWSSGLCGHSEETEGGVGSWGRWGEEGLGGGGWGEEKSIKTNIVHNRKKSLLPD